MIQATGGSGYGGWGAWGNLGAARTVRPVTAGGSAGVQVDDFRDLNPNTIDPHILDFAGNRYMISKALVRERILLAHATPERLTARQNLMLRTIRLMIQAVKNGARTTSKQLWVNIEARAHKSAKNGGGQLKDPSAARTVHPAWKEPSTSTKLGTKCAKLRATLKSGKAPYKVGQGGTPQTRVLGINIEGYYPPGAVIKQSWIDKAKKVCATAKQGDKVLLDAGLDPEALLADADALAAGMIPGENGIPEEVPDSVVMDDESMDESGNPLGFDLFGLDPIVLGIGAIVLAGGGYLLLRRRS